MAQQVDVSHQARESCGVVASLLEETPGLEVTRKDTVVVDPRTQREAWGCILSVVGSFTDFHDNYTPDMMLRSELPGRNWVENYDYGADGPDGTATAYRNGSSICFLRGSWDGGDISDSTYVPEDWYHLVVGCAESVDLLLK
jgi:hypothetical protein